MKKMNRVLSLLIVVTLSLSQAWAERVSRDDAALVANNFMNVASSNSAVKKTPAKKMVMKSVPAQEENLYYVYENENGEGWVIIAANDVVKPVLAYSETGHFRTENMPVNVRKWMGKYNHFIQKLEDEGVVAGEETKTEWKALRKATKVTHTPVVGPLIKTTWDQDDPFWDLCPGSGNSKAYTGCVATAMAQVMNYWQWPVKGTGSHSYQPLDPNTGSKSKRYNTLSVNFGETTYDWTNMKNSYTGSYTTAQGTAVATLIYHCGVATEMMYGNYDDGGSGTYTVNYGDWDWGTTTSDEGGCAQNALWYYFGYKKDGLTGYMRDGYTEQGYQYYDSWTDAAWTAMLKAELDKQHPILYGGGSSSGGHSFICDGYDQEGYFHFNWGWSGENDGYFLLSKLNPGSGGAGGGSYDFSEDQEVIIGIVPDKKDLPKVTVTWSVKGVTSTTEFTQEDALVLPEAPANCSESNVFVGWTKSGTVSGDAPADLFIDATGKVVTEAVTYYAVFAEVSEGESTPQEVATVTFATAANDGTQDYSSSIATKLVSSDYGVASYSGVKLYKGKEGVKMGAKSATGSITLTLTSSTAVSKVIVNASQYGSDTGKLTVTAGSTQLGDAQTPGSNLEFAAESDVTTDQITVATTSKRAYVASISVISGKGASYSNYSLECGSATDVESVNAEKAGKKKILIDGQLFIMHNGAMYNVQGTRVK